MVSNAEEIPRLCPSRARRRRARSRGECPARQRAGCTRFPSTAVDRSVVFDVYLLVSGIAQAIAAFTVGVSPGSRVWLFISGAVSVALGYFAFRDFKQRRRRVDDGSALDSYSKVSRRPHWRSMFQHCPSGAGTCSSGS